MRSRRQSNSTPLASVAASSIVGTCFVAWLMLAAFRTYIVAPDEAAQSFGTAFLSNLGASYKDLLFVASLGLFFILLVIVVRRWRWALLAAWALFLISIVVTVASGFANINVTKLLGEPFTYQWLLYADFLQNTDAKAAVRDAVNWHDIALIAGSVLAVLMLGGFLGWLAFRSLHRGPAVFLVLALIVAVPAAIFLMKRDVDAKPVPVAKVDNPIIHFAASVIGSTTPLLFTMKAGEETDEFWPAGQRSPTRSAFAGKPATPIKNVLVFVMESTPWEYLQTYGGKYPVTPNILKYASSSYRFDSIYAHAPATNYSLFSLFTSLYPDISYYSMTASYPDLPLKAVSGVFADRGYRTGFFWSGDSRFQAFDRFLQSKHFDTTNDVRNIACDRPIFEISSAMDRNMDYAYDVCTADTLANWIDSDNDKPFFAIMMTAMTHYPYTTNTRLQHYVDDGKQNEYLNALRIGDEAFGALMQRLEASGKLDSTLVVVLGDHGEAFGQHDNYGHATALYEENVHIPLMFINGQLFSGQSSKTVGGIIDVSPTVLDILGIPEPMTWQGRSLFSPNRPERAYFFSPWSGFLFGFRDHDTKTLYNAATGKVERYDLANDPRERVNLADGRADTTAFIAPMASWVQFQRKYIAEAVAMGDPNNPRCKLSSLTFDAAGTSYKGEPNLQIRVNDNVVGSVGVPGIESKASTKDAIIAELGAASRLARPISIKLPEIANAETIELRFDNDLWSGGMNGADRNVFVTNIAANGTSLPPERYKVVEKNAGVVTPQGAELYTNGSIVIDGPFVDGCS